MAELSIRYGRALYGLAKQQANFDDALGQAVMVHDALSTAECRSILEHPHISKADKRAFLDKVFSGSLNTTLNDFLWLLIDKNRENIIADALAVFIDLGNRFKGLVQADITSAVQLSEAQLLALKNLLSKKLAKQVEVSLAVDPSLIGGITIAVDGRFIDRSIRTQLQDLKNSIEIGRD
jgi:F-type H+-transporting ATPase subunit delta